ncbi:MAG TPA: UDP-N-acetylmuramoyl-L-alanine--D-glutamate ligase [Mariprofundaceae bacterium]|nr:UDP-N-acetylmuramoyl-L-alanine--D-glutamate ligase [Mariprofundaceae bacterium]
MSSHDYFSEQPVAVIGMGKTGQSLVRFLQRRGIDCEGFDEHGVTLPDDLHVPLHTGKLKTERLQGFRRIVVSPGVAWTHPALVETRAAGIPMCGDLDLFCAYFEGELVAVTGTNGKTTTVTLIETLFDVLPGGIKAGGNIGTPMLDLLADAMPKRVVLELSSFQLERSSLVHPHWAVLLNIQPDHADAHETPAAYAAAKFKLFEQQGRGDIALLPDAAEFDALADELRGRQIWVGRFGTTDKTAEEGRLIAGIELGNNQLFWNQRDHYEKLSLADLRLQGRHQHLNLAIAAQAAADAGIAASVIREALTSFRGLPHRLQKVGHIANRDWYDDSKATNPDAAAAALASFDKVLWICGGLRKGLDLMPLKEPVMRHVAHAFVIGKEPEPYVQLLESTGVKYQVAKTIDRAVAMAADLPLTLPVLLSPAAASQDQFKNYAERGDAFAGAVHALEKAA